MGNLRQEILDPGGLNIVTSYYYNALYQQVRVEKPEGDEVRYRYNSFGEVLRRESPDAGIAEYHYDPNGNLRFTQDANLRSRDEALFSAYDGLNRPTLSGIAAGVDSAAFAALRGDSAYTFESDTAFWISVNRYDKTPQAAAYPWNQYDITGVTGQMRNLKGRLAANAYRSGVSAIADDDTLTGQYGSGATFTARNTLTTGNPFEVTAPGGNVTLKAGEKITLKPGFHAQSGSRFAAAIDTALLNAPRGGKQWRLELFSYDYRGRVEKKWVFTDGLRGELVEPLPLITYGYEYNSQNAVTKTTAQVGTESFYHFYEYDRLGQLVKVYTSTTDNQPAQADVIYAYNPVGAVDTLRYGESGAGFTVELPYQYNVREWLTEIGNVGSAVLPFNAHYSYFGNGNIQKSEYRNTGSPMEQRYKYDYVYDNANRLLSANYQYHSGSWQDPARFDVSGLQYDGNGNILALNRKKEDNSTIDNLTYSYITGTNKLQSVTDAVATTTEDWDAEDTQFAYDGNGNVIEMLENGQPAISGIQYDHRNLPVSLLNRNGDLVTYRYDASGQRIFKKVGSLDGEYYIMDGAQNVAVFDESGSLAYWNILANGVSGKRTAAGEKRYYIKDHLGSTRAVVNDQGTVVKAHDYYPFGLLMPGRSHTTGEETKELFTGKERDVETGWDYFGARYYFASIGRFVGVDPVADKFPHVTPYNYAENEPIGSIDLWGLQRLKINDQYRTSAASKTMQVAKTIGASIRHPIAALRVGLAESGSTNISSVSARIARHPANNGNLSKGIGTERNALRHAIWSATINQEFGSSAAENLTSAHEGIGIADDAAVDMSVPFEGDLMLADDVVDFLNNEIGRSITVEGGNLSSLEIATKALELFKDVGLYTATVGENGKITIQRTKITEKQFNTAVKTLRQLNQHGFSPDEQKEKEDEK